MPKLATEDVGGRPDNSSTDTSFDSAALESKLQEQLNAMNSDGDEHLDDEVVDDETELLDQDDDSEVEDDSQAGQEDDEFEESDEDVEDEDDESDDEEIVEEAAEEPVKKSGKTPTLPDAFRRSLKAYGWTDDEIDHDLKVTGAGFVQMAANVHSKRNAEVAQWAELGRKAQEVNEAEQTPVGPVVNGQVQPLQPIDLKALKEKHGEEELLDEIIGPVNATINALNAVIPQVQQGVQAIRQTEMDATTAEIHKFFDDSKMEPFRKFYGGVEQDRTPEQLEHRRAVLEKALEIKAGAATLHRELTLQQALIEAHDIASADFREQAVRKGIKKEVKKRNRSISQRPSKRGTKRASNSGPSKNATERERKIGAKMRKVFGT